MMPTFQPPRRALRLLDWALPDDVRDHITGDLQEMYQRQFIARGEGHARHWYWRQSVSFALRFSWERLRTPRRAAGRRPASASNRPSWIDVKLGIRMLAKHPALTLIGGFAIMVSIGIGAAWFEFANDYIAPTIPLEDGERIVGIRNWDAAASEREPQSVHDFVAWREDTRTIVDLGAWRTLERNLISDDGRAETVRMAEMTAAAFRVARVQPLLGRGLLEDDERPGATPVVVLGYGAWQARFGGERDVVGRTVRVGNVTAEIVGVMPEGFAWPTSHGLWMPLRLDPAAHARRSGPSINMVGRLAPEVTLSDAQAELAVIGARIAQEYPETNTHLRPRVTSYVEALSDDVGREVLYVNALFIMILIVACTNVATLVFARAATREREIAVRNALGASRGRIIMQLFVESLVLASVAAAAGLVLTALGMKYGMRVFWDVQGGAHVAPFWWNVSLASATIAYVGLLTVIGAAVTGILPALKVTGRDVAARLRQATAGGAAIRFGGMWTAIIVVQVAITVTFLAAASSEGRAAFRDLGASVEVGAERFLSAQLLMDYDVPAGMDVQQYEAAFASKYARAREHLRRQLLAEPGVTAVSFGSQLPGMPHYVDFFDIDGAPAGSAPDAGRMLRVAEVDAGFFETFDVPVLSGREFDQADLSSGRRVAIVNQSFVQQMLGGRNPIGLRVREAAPEGAEESAWYEIVGVVKDLGMNMSDPKFGAGVYRPLSVAAVQPAHVAVRVGNDPASIVPRLRAIVAEVDPTMRLRGIQPLVEVARAERNAALAMLAGLGALVMVAFLLSTAGVYSLMSLTVSQRTREIGIRAALGADPRQILTSIFARALGQLSLGIGVGAAVVLLVGLTSPGSNMRESVVTAMAVAALMMLVGLSACVAPARRGLRIQPTEALRGEG